MAFLLIKAAYPEVICEFEATGHRKHLSYRVSVYFMMSRAAPPFSIICIVFYPNLLPGF